jgi:uncharacterized membrane protein
MPHVDYNAPESKIERIAQYASILLLFFLLAYTASSFAHLPDTVPTHVNMNGEIDGWGSRWFIWFLPFTAIFTFVLLLLSMKLPQAINYPVKITEENAQRQFLIVRLFMKILNLAMVFMFVVLQFVLVSLARHAEIPLNIGMLVLILLLIVFLPIALYLYLAFRAK